jgi:hypothetical protein
MKHTSLTITVMITLFSCTTIQPSIEPYLSPQVEKSYDSLQIVTDGTLPIEPHRLDMAPPTANAGKDDTVYFPQRGFALKGTCTGATSRSWTVLRTSLPAGTKDTMGVDLYRIFIDYRFTCRASNGQIAIDDKRVTLVFDPRGVLTTFDAGNFGRWVINNMGEPLIMFKSGQ